MLPLQVRPFLFLYWGHFQILLRVKWGISIKMPYLNMPVGLPAGYFRGFWRNRSQRLNAWNIRGGASKFRCAHRRTNIHTDGRGKSATHKCAVGAVISMCQQPGVFKLYVLWSWLFSHTWLVQLSIETDVQNNDGILGQKNGDLSLGNILVNKKPHAQLI